MRTKRKDEVFSVTSAPESPVAERDDRIRKYLIAMGLRLVCFFLAVATHGWLRWTFLALTVFLPYIGVIVANAGRELTGKTPSAVAPVERPALEGPTGALGSAEPGPQA